MIEPFGKRYTCFGAPSEDGTPHHRYFDRGNADSMINFVRSLHDTYGKVLLVMDNASIHKTRRVMGEIGGMGGDIRIIYQPKYSPDLNPIEMVWKELRRYVANGLYKKVEDMTGAIDEMIISGAVRILPLPGYATDAIGLAKAAAA